MAVTAEKGLYDLAGAVRAVATGAIWTRQMKFEAQHALAPDCRRCKAGRPETLRRWAYDCEGNRDIKGIRDHDEILLRVD